MLEQLVFGSCPQWIKEEVRACWRPKRRRLERLLGTFRGELRRLRLTVRRSNTRWEVHAVLLLPTGTLVSWVDSPRLLEAFDGAIDRLVVEIRRHKEHLRQDYVYHRKRRQPPHFWRDVS